MGDATYLGQIKTYIIFMGGLSTQLFFSPGNGFAVMPASVKSLGTAMS